MVKMPALHYTIVTLLSIAALSAAIPQRQCHHDVSAVYDVQCSGGTNTFPRCYVDCSCDSYGVYKCDIQECKDHCKCVR